MYGLWSGLMKVMRCLTYVLLPPCVELLLMALSAFGGAMAALFFDADSVCASSGCDADLLRSLLLSTLKPVILIAAFVLVFKRIVELRLQHKSRKDEEEKLEELRREVKESLDLTEGRVMDRFEDLDASVRRSRKCCRKRHWQSSSVHRRMFRA